MSPKWMIRKRPQVKLICLVVRWLEADTCLALRSGNISRTENREKTIKSAPTGGERHLEMESGGCHS